MFRFKKKIKILVLNKHPLGPRPIYLLFSWTRESLLHTMDLTKQQYLLSLENGLYILFLWYQLCLLLFTIKSLARCSRHCGILGVFQIKHLLFLSYCYVVYLTTGRYTPNALWKNDTWFEKRNATNLSSKITYLV